MIYDNISVTSPNENGDGIVVYGTSTGDNILENVNVDFCDYIDEHEVLDENISFVNHANSIVKKCVFRNGIKLCLVGNGDYPNEDKGTTVTFEDCIFENFGRRGIEVQDGVKVKMKNCVIKNWGVKEWFNIRSFASWSHKNADIELDHCYFIQNSFFQSGFINFFIDIANHIGESINSRSLSWKSFIPGVMRGAISTDRGTIKCTNCYKNKKWIYLENSTNNITNEKEALSEIEKIYNKCNYRVKKS